MTVNTPFATAVAEHGRTVLRVCQSVLGRGSDADDAWSDTFLAALQAWETLPDETNVQAWLVRVAQRKAIDVVRRRQRDAVPVAEPPEPPVPTSVRADDPQQRLEAAALWRAVAELPERQRLALAYHYLGGLPHTQTAELIGGTPAAVRRAAADGLKALRRRYPSGPATAPEEDS